MKLTLRLLTGTLSVLMLLLFAVSCGGGSQWKDDLTTDALCSGVQAALPAGAGWDSVSEDYISPSTWGEDYTLLLADGILHTIVVSSESDMNIDEIGVFHVKDKGDVKAVKTIVETYLEAKKERMASLLEAYNQAELPKLDCAKVTVCGNYVFYTILNAEDTTAAHNTCKDLLKAE